MALLFRNPSDVFLPVGQSTQVGLAAGTFSNVGANLSYTATLGDGTALPSWMTLNRTNGALSISGASAVGSYDVLVTAQDANGASAPAVETIVVTGAPTVLNPLADRSYSLGTSFSFSVPADTFTRAAGRTVSYEYNALGAIDSLTAGFAGSNYAQSFTAHLRGLYGDGGGGYQAFTNNPPTGAGRIAAASAGVSYLAGPTASPGLEQYSINGQGINVAAASASDRFVWDPNAAWDTATLYYLQQPGGGKLTLQGAGAAAPVTVDTAGALGLRSVVVHSDRGQSNDQITVQGMTGRVTLFGADFRTDTDGASFSNVAIPGTSLTNWSNLNTSFRQSWFGALAPEAYLLDAGMNDRGVLFGASYQTRIAGILNNFAAASPRTDILLIGPNDIGSSGQVYLDNYRAILAQEAANRGLLYVDDKAVLGSYATASAAGRMADLIHPNATGNALRAGAYLRALGFDPNGPTAGASPFLSSGAPAGLTYSATLASGVALPAWLSFNPASATFSASGQAVAGSYAVTVRAAAGGQTTADTFNLTVGGAGPGPSTGVEIVGDDTANTITGGAGDDTLRGNGGNDTVNGAGGNDAITGDTGDDVLIGGPGADTVYGGSGADRFVFQSVADFAPAATPDFIEFIAGDGDLIDLSAIDANTLIAGKQGFTFIGTGAFTGQAGQLRYQAGTLGGTQRVGADLNGDGQADLQFVVGAPSLAAGNFLSGSGGGGDVTPPAFQSATVNGASLILTYGEALDAAN
ncbi:putative Ig domain-containing protein, partial [Methylobacterium sp. WL9]|uniref:putative Ig domain-containing protein n=1 Tax=Methylobacterium sp. WL9 TaxID=2603898 RepID=UPI0011D6353B